MAEEQKFPLPFSVAVFGAEPQLTENVEAAKFAPAVTSNEWKVVDKFTAVAVITSLFICNRHWSHDDILQRKSAKNLSTMFLQDKTMKTKIISCSTYEVNVIRIIRVTLLLVFTTNMKYLLRWQSCVKGWSYYKQWVILMPPGGEGLGMGCTVNAEYLKTDES